MLKNRKLTCQLSKNSINLENHIKLNYFENGVTMIGEKIGPICTIQLNLRGKHTIQLIHLVRMGDGDGSLARSKKG